jgi:hypothetical protein
MFKLFENIFEPSRPKADRLPDDLLDAAIDRAVEGTDPRLKMMSAYDRKLRGPVARAVQYVIKLVDSLPPAAELGAQSLDDCPALAAIFYSPSSLQDIISHDTELKSYRRSRRVNQDGVNALVLVNTRQKRILGSALVDGETRKDVAQTTIDFHDQRFIAPSPSEAETRDLLKRRAFDHLLTVALAQITNQSQERKELQAHRAVLLSKLKLLTRSGGFAHQHGLEEQADLQNKMETIEQQLAGLGPDEAVIPSNLAMVVDVLETAAEHLWAERKNYCIDRYYVVHDHPTKAVPAIEFLELHSTAAEAVLVQLVKLV